MSLVSMKRAPDGQPLHGLLAEGPQEEYPYGLCVCLTEAEISKLNMAMPKVGQEMELEAKIVVRSVSINNNAQTGIDRRVELQITDLELKTANNPAQEETLLKGAARVLYEMEDM